MSFDYHMKLHYSQTLIKATANEIKFDYHMKLHYSQTVPNRLVWQHWFDYHMKLHYSQTSHSPHSKLLLFDYHMKLHYSQTTLNFRVKRHYTLCIPYGISVYFTQIHVYYIRVFVLKQFNLPVAQKNNANTIISGALCQMLI